MKLMAWSSWVVVIAGFAVLFALISRTLVFRKRERSAGGVDRLADEDCKFDIDKYRPMAQLLDSEDLRFLESQPGYRPELGRQWRRERRHVFRLYLTELKNDFRALHTEARRLVADADADSAHLVSALLRQRWVFVRLTTALEARLALAGLGIGNVDATPLVQLLETMRADLARRSALQTA